MPRYRNGGVPGSYRRLRPALNEQLRPLPGRHLESVLAGAGIDADAAEDWLSSLANIGAQVLPVAGSVVGGIYGGPAGAALGGQLGGMAGGALGQLGGNRPPPGAPRTMTPAAPPSSPPQSPPGVTAPATASAQLLQLLSRPEVQRALFSMALGANGASAVPVGTTTVPVSAVSNLIGQLAQQATAEYESIHGEGTDSSYLESAPGSYDATNPVDRAEATRRLFEQEDRIRLVASRRVPPRRPPPRMDAYEAESFPEQSGSDVWEAGWTERDYHEAALLVDALSDMEA